MARLPRLAWMALLEILKLAVDKTGGMKYIRDRNSEMSVGRKPVLSISLKNEGPATAGTLHYSPRLGESLLAGFLLPSHGACISNCHGEPRSPERKP
jgi:hypothetical protein